MASNHRTPIANLIVAFTVAVFLHHQASAQEGNLGPPNPLNCTCTDVDVRTLFIAPVQYNCWEQYKFGSCSQQFMKDAIKEVPEGYCQITCGRCACCKDLAAVAEANDLTEFLWAMNRTALEPLNQPGIMATLLAPDNNAMQSLFDKLGGKQKIESDPGVTGKLNNIMSYHVVQPLPGYEAWTTPFFTPGTKLTTWSNQTLEVAGGGDGGSIKIQGAGSAADIQKKDLYACKGYINVLNWYLLPPGEQLS